MENSNILIIDDNQLVLRSLKLVLKNVFKTVTTLTDPHTIMGVLNTANVDIVLLDMNFDSRKLDGEEGLFWLSRINELPKPPAVVLITAFGDIDLAVRSVQSGAEDFVTKPWSNDVLISKLKSALEKHKEKMDKRVMMERSEALLKEMESMQKLSLEEMERKHILDTVAQEGGNLVSTASRLEISRQTLYNKLKKYGVIN